MELSPELVLAAYCQGIFPMADARDGVVRWYEPRTRAIFVPGEEHISHSLARTYRRGDFEVYVNRDFEGTMRACADRPETWISEGIVRAYATLHQMGFAHSVEAYREGARVGGLYGIAIGGAFFGESMFSRATDASKVCFLVLCRRLRARGYVLLDAQFMTDHLASLGAIEVSRAEYLRRLHHALELRCSFAAQAASGPV